MTKYRASIFDTDEIDVSGFSPKAGLAPDALPADQVRAIAEASQFPSREATTRPQADALATPAKRQPRRHRTGRTAQFNARTTPETVAAFYAIADQQSWLVGETMERALAALQRELKEQGSG